ncbi:MAG: efflux RND transporter periplasmic adaptor subunit [Limnobacter sp.]|uniref:efflux RND transporter periplasmic adaptor subunit n=1 Tax=Limnobacter sp. TaxID=2003368 RepID=UPI0039189802
MPEGRAVTRRKVSRWVLLLALVGAAAGSAWWWTHRDTPTAQADGQANKPGRGGPPGMGGPGARGDRPVPVNVLAVRQQDFPLVMTAIGSAVPQLLVTVRSRVDGELVKLHFQEGQTVKAGQLLAEIDPRPFKAQLDQVKGELVRNMALLDNARLDLQRYQDLLAKDAIARQQVDTQAALVRQYEGTVQTGRGQVDNAQLQLQYTRITAPISGRVGLRAVDPGNQVKASDTNGLVSIAQTDPMRVVFTVSESQLPEVASRFQGGKNPLVVEAWNREQTTRLAQGRLQTIDNLIDATTGTVKLKATLPNPQGLLFANQFVNIRLVLGQLTGAKVVNTAAVLRGASGSFVYRVQEDGTVKAVPVKALATEGALTAVEGELAVGDRVVSDGTDKLRDGAKVEVVDPNATPKGKRPPGAGGGTGPKSGPKTDQRG